MKNQIKILAAFVCLNVLVSCSQNREHMYIEDIHGGGKDSQSVPSNGSGPYYTTDILPIINNTTSGCLPCHGTGAPMDWTNYDIFKSKKNQLLQRVLGPTADMPIGRKLADSDKTQLQKWILVGMPYAPVGQPTPGPIPGPTPTPPGPTPGPTPTPSPYDSCAACHGDKGVSTNSMFPKLAGQAQAYIVNQLIAFRSKARSDDDAQAFMWSVAVGLSDSEISTISNYYSSQTADISHESPGDAAKVAAGKNIYNNGIPANGVLACSMCHGAQGLGNSNFPRLAGQFSDYTSKQLHYFQTGKRSNDPTMSPIGKKMTDQEIEDVSEYIKTLGTAPAPVPNPVPNPNPGGPVQIESCAACHGDKGHSTNEMFPKLAGQTSEYILIQLTAFHDKTRAAEDSKTFMWPIAANLSKDDMKFIAKYFSTQKPAPNHEPVPSSAMIAMGKDIYNNGLPKAGILACSMCHGAQGEGNKKFPALARQFTSYISKQLNYFKSGQRVDPTMTAFAKRMTQEESNAVSAFVNSL